MVVCLKSVYCGQLGRMIEQIKHLLWNGYLAAKSNNDNVISHLVVMLEQVRPVLHRICPGEHIYTSLIIRCPFGRSLSLITTHTHIYLHHVMQ